jgi:hypothetical protein
MYYEVIQLVINEIQKFHIILVLELQCIIYVHNTLYFIIFILVIF